MTKKILAIILAALMVAALAACTGGEGEDTTDDGKINITTEGTTAGNTEETTEPEDSETGGTIDTSAEKTPGELEYTESVAKVYILHENGAVNLRKADGTVFKSFPNGTELQMIAVSTDGEITKVVYEDEEYYIYSSCVTDLADLDEGFAEVSKTLVLATGGLNIRIAPSMNNRIVGSYAEGDTVKVVAENTEIGWYKVEFVAYGGATAYGYVANDAKYYVQDETDTSEEITTEADTEGDTETETAA